MNKGADKTCQPSAECSRNMKTRRRDNEDEGGVDREDGIRERRLGQGPIGMEDVAP